MELRSLSETSGVKFGTSGARGLVADMTDRVCYAYARGFLQQQKATGRIAIAGDLRPSTERILKAIHQAISDAGCETSSLGRVPTPALALYGIEHAIPSIMVTGSHIPDDRNGIKFHRPDGEITKSDELAMLAQSVQLPDSFDSAGMLVASPSLPATTDAETGYLARYFKAFSPGCLAKQTVGVYGHSAVGRELLVRVLESLGARVVRLGWSETFVPVDTEAIRPEDVELAQKWAHEQQLDAIVSTDGDSDRPLLADEHGNWFRGDVLGVVTARYLKAHSVVTPVSSNSLVELSNLFARVERTQIGSPFVIAAMQALAKDSPSVVAYEANGGCLVQNELSIAGGSLSPLATRDAILPLLCALDDSARRGIPVSALTADLPKRFTTSDRLKNIAAHKSQQLLMNLLSGGLETLSSFVQLPEVTVTSVNTVDGLRMQLSSGEIVHVRPSGNAPELRCYVEAASVERAAILLRHALATIAKHVG